MSRGAWTVFKFEGVYTSLYPITPAPEHKVKHYWRLKKQRNGNRLLNVLGT